MPCPSVLTDMAYRATSIRNEHPGAVAAPRGRLFQWLEHFPFKRSSSEEEPAEPEAEIARRYDRAENRRAKLYPELGGFMFRSEERRVGKEGFSTFRSWWSTYPSN